MSCGPSHGICQSIFLVQSPQLCLPFPHRLSQGQMTSFSVARSPDSPVPASSESIKQVPLPVGTSILIWKKFATLLDFSRGSCWPTSPRGCTLPWDTAGHLGESLAKTGEARQPRLRNLLKDRAMRALGGALGRLRGQEVSREASLLSVTEGPRGAMDPLHSPFCSKPDELSKATLMGEGQMVLLGRRMKRLGEAKGFLGERQEEEKGLEGDGGTQVPVYTVRWGLGAMCWPGWPEMVLSSGQMTISLIDPGQSKQMSFPSAPTIPYLGPSHGDRQLCLET